MSSTGRGARIRGLGIDLPDKVVTNAELAETLDTSDEWVRERTGIRQRHIGGVTSTMAIAAGARALDDAGVDPSDIDLLILATTSADQIMPGTAAVVHAELGLGGGAHDLNAACAGFAYGLVEANAMIMAGLDNVLLIGADALSLWTDWTDRSTAVLFADGAGAAVLCADDQQHLLGWDLGADGDARHILYIDHGDTLKMEGREVFRRAIRALVSSTELALDRAGLTADQIDWVIPHQANVRIIESALSKLRIPMDKAVMVIEDTANTSAASIPLALHAGVDDRRIKRGDTLLLSGFGAGMSWGTAVVRWNP